MFRALHKRFRSLDRDELRSAAGIGVAKAVSDYRADRTRAAYLWLIVAGRERAINALRSDGFLTRDHMQRHHDDPRRPVCETDLSDAERDQFVKATTTAAPEPGEGELFTHPRLTDEESAVLVARYADHRTWQETAAALGLSVGVCRRREASARKKLRRALESAP